MSELTITKFEESSKRVFGQLKPGEVFEYRNIPFMRLLDDKTYNAVNLSTYKLTTFANAEGVKICVDVNLCYTINE